MVKRNNLIKCLILSMMFGILVFVPNTNNYVDAQTITEPVEILSQDDSSWEEELEGEFGDETEEEVTPPYQFQGFEIPTTVVTDSSLYSALLKCYKMQTNGTDKEYSGSTLYSDMFIDFETINLDQKNISSLDGLESFDFDNLVSFSANMNKITSVSDELFQTTDENKFKSLSLASNEIKQISFKNMTGLNYINLSSNQLTGVDLLQIEGVNNSSIEINLANNQIESMKAILLPQKRIGKIYLNIIGNNVTEIAEEYFNANKYDLKLGIQGFVSEEIVSVDTKTNLVIHKIGVEGIGVAIYKIDGLMDELVKTVTDTDIPTTGLVLDLPVGEYEFCYTLNGQIITEKDGRKDHVKAMFVSREFRVLPQIASHVYVYKNKEYTSLGKVTGKVIVKLSSSEDAEIFYQVNGGEWQKGTVIECGKGGTYNIKTKTMINGYESVEGNIWVKTSLNLYIPDGLMLVLLLLLSLVLFFVVLPVISKKFFKKD